MCYSSKGDTERIVMSEKFLTLEEKTADRAVRISKDFAEYARRLQ